MAVFRAGSKLTDLCSIVDSLVSKREQQFARSAADAAGAGPRYSIERDAALHSALQEHETLAQPGPRAAATSAAGVPAAKELSRAPLAAALSACPADGIPFWKPVAASAIAPGSEPSSGAALRATGRDAHARSALSAPAAHTAPGLAFTLPPVSVAADTPTAAAAIGGRDAARCCGASPARPDGPAPPRAERVRPAPLHPVVRLSPPAIPPGIVPPRQRGPQLASPSSARPTEPAGATPPLEAPKLAPIWAVDAATAQSRSASPVTVAGSREPSFAAADAPHTSPRATPRATPPAGLAPAARCSTPEAARAAGRIAVVGSLHSHKAKLNLQTKQYACEKCGRAFFRRSDYVRHFQIHLGIKPNSCAICGKAFIQRSALNVHVRVHTGEKPYQCSACNRQFSDSSSLARHRRIHARQPAPAPQQRIESAAVAARAQRPWP